MKYFTIIFTILLAAACVFAETIIVDQQGGGDYLTIGEGIAAANPGDVVLVMPGVYVEGITLDITITLQSQGGAEVTSIINGTNIITVLSGSSLSEIIGFTITGSNDNGIYSPNNGGGTCRVFNCIITTNLDDGILFENHSVYIYNSIFAYNGQSGIHLRWNNADGTLRNNIIHSNSSHGIYIDDNADPNVYSNIIYDNDNRGIYVQDGTTGDITYNNSFENQTNYNYYGFNIGPTNISEDPEFMDFPNDLHLQSISPCIDTGMIGSQYNDPNGTRNDMGIFGGPNCWGGGGPGITEIELTPTSVPQGGTINIEASGTVQ